MADNHNFRIKNGLEVGGVEVITANGVMVLPNTSTAATQDGGTNNTRIATTAFVQQEITSLIGGAPGSLNTLNELAAAINDDASYASTLTTALATKLPLAGGTLTGNLSLGVYSTTATASLLLNGSTANKQSVLKCTDGNLHIDAASGNSVYLNWYGGTGGTFFGNGSAGQKARIDGSGNLTLSGTVDGVDISARDAILTSTTTTANAAYGWGNHASAGYTNDQTAAEILTAIKTVDGSGSGLDADLLDGIQGSSFLRSDATDTASGAVTFSAATIYMAGDLAHSGDTNTYMGFHAADQWRVVTGGVERLEVNNTAVTVSGNFTATGNITAYSDIRLKEDIKPIEDAVSKVQQLTGNTYTRNDLKDPERRYGGVIAQEVEVVLPEAVNDSEDGTKTVDYNAMIALLIESIKELKAEVDDLKTQLENK